MAVRTRVSQNSKRKQRSNLLGSVLLSLAIIGGAALLNRGSAKVEASVQPSMIVAQFDTITLPVPVDSVSAGVKIKDIRFKNVSFPKQQVPEGAITLLDSYLESVTVASLPANLPLFRKNLSMQGQSNNPVMERIPPGMRAMTVKVDATAAVEGWAGSGSIVDVLLVERTRTTVIAENVKILSAERNVSPVEGNAAPNVPSTITLLVTQEQCLAINTAIPIGKIAFALRSSRDQEKWASTRYSADSLRGGAVMRDKKGVITGYVAMNSGGHSKGYALSNGKWIETAGVPEGFFNRNLNSSIGDSQQDAKD